MDSLAVVALLGVVGELLEQFTGELRALAAMLEMFPLAAGFYRTCVPPRRVWRFHSIFRSTGRRLSNGIRRSGFRSGWI